MLDDTILEETVLEEATLEDIVLDDAMLDEIILDEYTLLDDASILDDNDEDSVGTYGAFLLVGIVPLAGLLSGSMCLCDATYSRNAL